MKRQLCHHPQPSQSYHRALKLVRMLLTVADIDDTLARLQKMGAQLVGEVVKYEELYRLCYIRGPEGILIGLAEQLSKNRNPL